MQILGDYGAELTFKPSATNAPGEYCINAFKWNMTSITNISSYCMDIDNILINYCGNITLFRIIDPLYDETLDPTNMLSCRFFLEDDQVIGKTYLLSDNIPVNHIIFSSENHLEKTNIMLSQSFLSITSYEGSIDIINIDFESDGSTFSLIDVVADDIELYIKMDRCQFADINGVNGSIINMPNTMMTDDYIKTINVKFDNCRIENVLAIYGAILYIERNNVAVTFLDSDIANVTSTYNGSGIIHWICQEKNNGVELCGDLLITNSDFSDLETNVFTIDLWLDPSNVFFMLEVDTATFTNINGIIFNFNHNNDVLGPVNDRIQAENAFINVKNSHFEDNGNKQGKVSVWWPPTYTQTGTIFTINSVTVPNITIENSNFTHNTALHGAIFYWHCSRDILWIKENHCGNIVLQKNTFYKNMVDENKYNIGGVRYGSLLYAEINQDMEFNILIQNCDFIEDTGNLIYFKTSSIPILTPPSIGNSSFGNSSHVNKKGSIICVEACTFKDNKDLQEGDFSPNLGTIFTISGLETVYTFITDSTFDNNEANWGTPIFSADYAPIIHVINSNFTNNNARVLGLFNLRMNDISVIKISDSRFENNGYYSSGGYASDVSILSTNDNIYLSLTILKSFFIGNINSKYGCFNLYSADINIIDSTFDSNQGDLNSVVILNVREYVDFNINHTIFKNNRENTIPFPSTGIPAGLFNINTGNIIANDVTFEKNVLFHDGIFVTTGSLYMSNNRYINNYVPTIVKGATNIYAIKSDFLNNKVKAIIEIDSCVINSESSTIYVNSESSTISIIHSRINGNTAIKSPTKKPCDICYDTMDKNPCTDENIAAGKFYFPSCSSCCNFIQCDQFGNAFDIPCARGNFWDQVVLTCNHNNGQCQDDKCLKPTPKYHRQQLLNQHLS